jgi:hypothetical protein
MPGDIKWKGYAAAAASRLTTELNSLANNSTSALSAEIDNTTNLYRFADFELNLASLTPTGTPYVSVYIVPTIDGTNYPGWDAGASPGNANNNYWVGDIQLKAAAGTVLQALRGVLLPPGKYKVGLRNASGVTLASSGNTLDERQYTEAYT